MWEISSYRLHCFFFSITLLVTSLCLSFRFYEKFVLATTEMWKAYSPIIKKYSRISLKEERRLIRKAKKGSESATQELVLRHIGFVIFRIHKRAFPAYARRFGEDLLSQGIVVLYQKIH